MFGSDHDYFHQGQSRAKHKREGGKVEYLIMPKESLVLASTSSAPYQRFYHQGQTYYL